MNTMHQPYRDNDEIDLVDLFLGLKKHWLAMLVTFCVLAVMGLVVASQWPQKFSYTTVLSVGGTLGTDGVQPLETPESVMAELENAYLPAELRAAKTVTANPPRITISIPKGSNVVLLSAKGTRDQGSTIEALMKASLAHVIRQHAGLLDSLKNTISAGYALRMGKLDDQIGTMKASLDTKGLRASDRALMTNQLQALQQQKVDLKQQLQQALTALRPTVLVGSPQQSPKPVGLGPLAITALSLMLSVMGAFGAGMLGMFADAINQRSLAAKKPGRTPAAVHPSESTRTEPSLVPVTRRTISR